MKFAKTLEDLMVPEWRTQYVEYKVGKKRIKTTTDNLRNATPSPALTALRRTASRVQAEMKSGQNTPIIGRVRGLSMLLRPASFSSTSRSLNLERTPRSSAVANATGAIPALPLERSSLQWPPTATAPWPVPTRRATVNYGSSGFSPSFPRAYFLEENLQPPRAPSLLLPDPIHPIGSPAEFDIGSSGSFGDGAGGENFALEPSSMSIKSVPITSPTIGASRPILMRSESRIPAAPNPPFLRRIFTLGRTPIVQPSEDGPAIEEVQAAAEKEFLKWLLGQLKKCEDFYQRREMESMRRFDEMREQLDIMRDRWFKAKHNIPFEEDDVEDIGDDEVGSGPESVSFDTASNTRKRAGWKTFAEAMNGLTRPYPTIGQVDTAVLHPSEGTRDYVRQTPARKPINNPAHRVAKRKLKRAYIEYYHGLEMLKSYVTVNRECFRKITKKFDKASGLRTSHRFMTAYVDKSKFGGADNDLDDMLNDTEVLFARFFERGNRKEASARLRSRESKTVYYRSVWMTGFYLGCTLIIGAYGLHSAIEKLNDHHTRPEDAVRTSYLLQIWGGVALLLAQTLLFAINLRVWALSKINYSFIFEFDTRHQLNYRQFLELPALLSLIFAVCFWFSSHDFWNGGMDMIYWPVFFSCLAGVLLLNPLQIWYYHSRMWMLRMLWRIFFSGLYPVEFKDFWMGDMLCSQTYAMGNISLFLCLYSNKWSNPAQCNSNHSQLMGFFTALPGIWRCLQCIRRYKNSKMWFPHLVNGGKYFFTVCYYIILSIWRIDKYEKRYKATFIAVATINSIYCSIWDVGMDWSLLDPYAEQPFLRKNLGFKQSWPYYLAIFINPILRCSWLFYLIYADKLQHSALMTFLLALTEVLRRFMWCFFRMENEHIGNVGANRAYRSLPLPYRFRSDTPSPSLEEEPTHPQQPAIDVSATTASQFGTELDIERTADNNTLRRRSARMSSIPGSPMIRTAMSRVGRTVKQAHMQDYERRRPNYEEADTLSGESDDEEDGDDDYYERTREAEGTTRRASGIVGSRA